MSTQITLCMIVRDEEPVLEETIRSFEGEYDELVIVDTGSQDDTVEISRRLGARVEHFQWCNDFSAARNYAASRCTTEWVLMPDADERLDPECRGMIRKLVNNGPDDVTEYSPVLVCPGGTTTEHYCSKLYRRGRAHWQNPSHNVLMVDQGLKLKTPELRLFHERGRRGEERNHQRSEQRNEMNEENFRQQVAEEPQNPRARWYLSLTVQEAGRPGEAIPLWEDYLARGTWAEERYEARRELAQCLIAEGRTDEAVEHLVLCHMEEPRRAEAAMMLGDMYASGRAYHRAALWYDVAARAPSPLTSGCQLFTCREAYGPWPLLRRARLAQLQGDIATAKAYVEAATLLAQDEGEDVFERVVAEGARYTAPVNSEEYWDNLYGQGRNVGDGHRAMFQAVADVVAAQPGISSVLDVAAGTGEVVDALLARGLEAVGVDFSGEAADRHERLRQDDALTLATCTDGSFDAVISVSLLEHLEDPEQALEQMLRVLRPGGLLLACVPIETGPLYFEHLRQYTPETLAEFLRPSLGDVQTSMCGRHCMAWGRKAVVHGAVAVPTVDIYCGPAYEPWGPMTASLRGLRGAWKATAQVAEGLAHRGWRVRVWADPSWDADDEPVEWCHYRDYDPSEAGEVMVACRRPGAIVDGEQAGVYWHHDIAENSTPGIYHPLTHVCVSEWQAAGYRRRLGKIETVTIPVGVDCAVFQPQEDERPHGAPRLLFAAQPQRGLDIMLDCWERLRPLLPGSELLVVGSFDGWCQEGHGEEAAKTLARRVLTTPGVRWWGMVPEPRLADLMAMADLLVYPATWPETFCTVAAEAQASGLPIVARAFAALPETCAGDVGVLVDGDPQAETWRECFVAEVVALVQDRERLAHFGATARNDAIHRFNLPVVVDRWDELLRELI